jgi:porin
MLPVIRSATGWSAVLLSCSLLSGNGPALAADPVVAQASPATAADAKPAKALPDAADKVTYPDLLDGTLSAGGDLDEEVRPHSGLFRRPTAMDPYFAWKQQLRQDYGFSFGGSYTALWQNYSSSRIGLYNAVGGKFTLNLSYDLFNRGAPNAMSFDMAVEDRRALGTDLPPLQAGFGAGSIIPTAATFGQFDLGITQAYIRQSLDDNRFQYTIGKIFAPNFIDAYPFFDDNRQFLSQAFSTSPTIASPLRGFGAVAAVFPADNGLYIKPGVFTNNSSDTGSTIQDFFTENERFYMLEVGFSGLAGKGVPIQARGPSDANNIHLTGWYRDAMQDGSMPRSYGVAFNANQQVGDNIMWFLRAGWSEGWGADRAVSAGFGWRPVQGYSDLFGFGLGWTRPASQFLDSQYTAEAFYRFHVTPNFAITPDIQLQLHPALNPAENALWVFSLRARIVF